MNRMLSVVACAGLVAGVMPAVAMARNAMGTAAQPESQPAAQPDTRPGAASPTPVPTPPPAPIADGEEFPTGLAVMQRSVEARGGLAAWKQHKTVRLSGRFTMEMMQVSGPIEVCMQQPNGLHVLITIDGMGDVVQAVKGDAVWVQEPGVAVQVIEGERADRIREQADFLAPFEPARVVEEAVVTAVEPVRGVPAYRVEVDQKEGEDSVNWYAVDSGHLIRKATYDENGVIASDTHFSAFKRFGDIMHPTRTEIRAEMGPQQIVVETVEYDIELAGEMFTPPGEL